MGFTCFWFTDEATNTPVGAAHIIACEIPNSETVIAACNVEANSISEGGHFKRIKTSLTRTRILKRQLCPTCEQFLASKRNKSAQK